MGIRPEDIDLTPGAEKNCFSANVDVVEPLGDQSFVYFTIGQQTYTASVDGELYIEEGSTIDFYFPENRIHLFDAQTGSAIKNREPPKGAELGAHNPQNTSSVATGPSDD